MDMSHRIQHDANNFSNNKDGISDNTWTRDKYVRVLRVLLSDFSELNLIHGSQESSDEKLSIMMDLILSDFNQAPPESRFTFEQFPDPHCLLQGAIAMTLDSASILHARNALQYSDNGIGFEDFGKDPRYAPLANKALQYYMKRLDEVKRSWNAARCFGSIRSEYRHINGGS